MKRSFLNTLIVMAFALSLSACSNNASIDDRPVDTSEATPFTNSTALVTTTSDAPKTEEQPATTTATNETTSVTGAITTPKVTTTTKNPTLNTTTKAPVVTTTKKPTTVTTTTQKPVVNTTTKAPVVTTTTVKKPTVTTTTTKKATTTTKITTTKTTTTKKVTTTTRVIKITQDDVNRLVDELQEYSNRKCDFDNLFYTEDEMWERIARKTPSNSSWGGTTRVSIYDKITDNRVPEYLKEEIDFWYENCPDCHVVIYAEYFPDGFVWENERYTDYPCYVFWCLR